nr:hypothetical protein [Tanacetum cinerariifolium]
ESTAGLSRVHSRPSPQPSCSSRHSSRDTAEDVAPSRGGDGRGEDRPLHTMYAAVAWVALLTEQRQTKAQFGRQGRGQAEYPRQDPEPLLKGNHGYERPHPDPV